MNVDTRRGSNATATPSVSGPVTVQIQTAVVALREDTRDEAALGDIPSQNRNIVVSNAACVLAELIEGNDEHRKLAVEAGGVEALVFALKRRPNSEAVQTKATITLGLLVDGNVEYQSLAGEAGAIEAVASAIRSHPNSVAVLEHAVKSLGQLVSDAHKKNQQFARRAGGIEAVITALQHHQGSEALQISASFTLGSLVATCCDNQLRASRAGAIEAIVDTIKAHTDREVLQEHAIEALGHLVDGHRGNQTLAHAAGAIGVTLGILGEYSKSPSVQWRTLRALRRLVADHRESQLTAGSQGGITAVLSALRNYSGRDEEVLEHACDALHHMVSGITENQVLARDAGLLSVIIPQVLEQQHTGLPAQAKAALAVGSMVVDNTESQTLAGEGGAANALTALLQLHPDCEALQGNATEALGHLVAKHKENQRLARKAGAIEKILEVLGPQQMSAAIRCKALDTLRKLLVGNQVNTMVAVAAGWVDEVVLALQRRESRLSGPGSPGYDAASHQAYQKLAADAGLIEAAVDGLRQSAKTVMLDYVPLQGSLLATLQDLVVLNYESQRLAADCGGVELVVTYCRSFLRHESVLELAARTLAALVLDNAANQRRVKAAEGEEVLLEAQKAYPESPLVQEATKTAMDYLFAGSVFASRIMETEYGHRHKFSVQISDVALRGVTLEQLTELQEFMVDTLLKLDLVDAESGKSATWDELTLFQVREHFILPLTQGNRCSFAESVAPGMQPPMWMVSHWWGTPFAFTVRMLQLQARSRHLHGASCVTYWCDAFANNQHDYFESEEVDVMKFPFARAMLSQACVGTVLLVDPKVTLLLRTWCVFEAYITHQLRCGALSDRTDKKKFFLDILAPVLHRDPVFENQDKVTITMLQDAIGGSWNEVSDNDDEGVCFPLDIAHIGVGVDVCKSEATGPDKAAILNYLSLGVATKDPPVEAHPKYDELNTFVHMVFASAELYRVASERPAGALETIASLLQMRADVNSFVRKGNTALFAAAGADPAAPAVAGADAVGQRELVEMLLKARADVNHANAEMMTVLDCASDLPEDARGLLLEHGAKSFVDAAPELERSANAHLSQILLSGFASERQAFVGGDAGTKLGVAAQRSLQVAATKILKLYHWAPCRISVQVGSGKHQATLADARAESVRFALESAGCKNRFTITSETQSSLLRLSLSLAPPRSFVATPTTLLASGPGTLSAVELSSPNGKQNPKSPHAALMLRPPNMASQGYCQGKLPPVSFAKGEPAAAGRFGHSASRAFLGPGGAYIREASDAAKNQFNRDRLASGACDGRGPRIGINSAAALPNVPSCSNVTGPARPGVVTDWENLFDHGWPSVPPANEARPGAVNANGRPVGRNKLRQALAARRMAWSQSEAQLGGGSPPAAQAQPSSDETPRDADHAAPAAAPLAAPSGASSPKYRNGPVDLDNLAGERWLQTSITCTMGSPALSPAPGSVADAAVVAGAPHAALQAAAASPGLFPTMSESQGSAGSGDPWRHVGLDGPAGTGGERGRPSEISGCGSRRVNSGTGVLAVQPDGGANRPHVVAAARPRAAYGSRPEQRQPGEGRPGSRGGQRHKAACGGARGPTAQIAANCSKSSPALGLGADQVLEEQTSGGAAEVPMTRGHNLPTLTPVVTVQRGNSRLAGFSIADLKFENF